MKKKQSGDGHMSGTGAVITMAWESSDKSNKNLEIFLRDSNMLLNKCIGMLSKKNHDYASNADVFSNFKSSAKIAGVTPAQSTLVLLGVKVSRLSELVSNDKHPMNEKIEDSILDLINYALLLHGLLKAENDLTSE